MKSIQFLVKELFLVPVELQQPTGSSQPDSKYLEYFLKKSVTQGSFEFFWWGEGESSLNDKKVSHSSSHTNAQEPSMSVKFNPWMESRVLQAFQMMTGGYFTRQVWSQGMPDPGNLGKGCPKVSTRAPGHQGRVSQVWIQGGLQP